MTLPHDTLAAANDGRFEEVLAAYLEAADAGWAPSRRAFLERYPAWRDRLQAFFDAADEITLLAGPLRGHPPQPGPTSQPTVLLDGRAGDTLPRPFGEYELQQLLGRGGMGVVYKALQKPLGRTVAVKMLQPGTAGSPDDVQRFRNEADATARMDHPNIVPIYEVGEREGRPFFSMKLLAGSLSDRADRYRDRPADAAALVEKVARAVHHAHQRGVLHRDLKPGNVLLDEQGEPVVTDFGLARRIEQDTKLTVTGAILGTPSYMAPEQASGRGEALTTGVDVYALGAILYELLTGQPPFKAENALETLLQVREQRPIAPRARNAQVPRDLETICLKCLHKDPAKRYATAADLADDLRRWGDGELIRARPAGVAERLWNWACRRPAAAAASVLGSLAMVLGLVYLGALSQLRDLDEARREASSIAEAEKEARVEVEAKRADAVAERAKAEQAQERAERALYYNGIMRAHLAWENEDRAQAEQALENCPRPLRGWEWQLVNALARPPRRELRESTGHHAAVHSVACSADGALVATGGMDRTAILWDAKNARPLHVFKDLPPFAPNVAFSADGKTLACAVGTEVRLWDTRSGKAAGQLEGHREGVGDVAFSPDGKRMATASNDGLVRVFEAGKLVHTLKGHNRPVLTVAFGPDGRRLLSAGHDGVVTLWDAAKGEQTRAIKATADPQKGDGDVALSPLKAAALSPDGRRVATIDQRNVVRLHDVDTAQPLATSPGPQSAALYALAFSPEGTELAAGGNRFLRVWSASTGVVSRRLPRPEGTVNGLAFSSNGWLCVASSESAVVPMIDLRAGARRVDLPTPETWPEVPLVFSPDGRLVTSTERGPRFNLFDVETNRVALTLRGHQAAVRAAAFSADGKRLLTAGDDRTLKVWDAATGKLLLDLGDQKSEVGSVALSPDGLHVACACRDGTVRVFDAKTGRALNSLERKDVRQIMFSPDGGRVVTSSGNGLLLQVWGAGGGALIGLGGHADTLNHFCFSPDGAFLATASADRSIILHSFRGGGSRQLNGHTGAVLAVAFMPDGKRLASAGADRTVRLWDTELGTEVLTLRDHGSVISSLAFSADGTRLLGGVTGRNRVHVWSVPGK